MSDRLYYFAAFCSCGASLRVCMQSTTAEQMRDWWRKEHDGEGHVSATEHDSWMARWGQRGEATRG